MISIPATTWEMESPESVDDSAAMILVVDDQPVNRLLLEEILEPHGYQVVSCSDGQEALQRVQLGDVDLVLLDITMPLLDGLEVCRRLRADPATASLPIIMVTALAHREQQLDGIAAGATDYLTKPIDSANLLLRVRNALQMRRLHVRVAAQLSRLQELERLRDSLVHMLVHDLRSPLQSMVFGLDFARERARELQEAQLTEDLDSVANSARVLTDMVGNVLDVSRFEEGAMPLHPETFPIRSAVCDAIDAVGGGTRVVVASDADEAAQVYADPVIVRRVVANLVANACKFSPEDCDVHVHVRRLGSHVEVRVNDAGRGIAPEHHAVIFDKFGQVTASRGEHARSSGLGLAFCKLAVEANGGTIGVDSTPGQGASFWFTLPQPT